MDGQKEGEWLTEKMCLAPPTTAITNHPRASASRWVPRTPEPSPPSDQTRPATGNRKDRGREIPSTCADADRYCDRPPAFCGVQTRDDDRGMSHRMITPPRHSPSRRREMSNSSCFGKMPVADGPKWSGPGISSGEN